MSILRVKQADGTWAEIPALIGPRGLQGEKGEKGDAGESGVYTPVSGFIALSVDTDGNLWVHTPKDEAAPFFEYDSETGALYYVTE